jgi:hypothetical protein
MDGANPYGAVPAALSDASKTFLGVAHNFLEGKKLEQDLSLARMKAETEAAIVNANMERDRLTNAKDMAHMDMLNEHFNKTYGLQEAAQKFTQDTQWPTLKSNIESEITHRGTANTLLAAQTKELAYKMEKRPLGDWLSQSNIDPRIGETMGFDLKRVLTREEAIRLETQYQGYVAPMGLALAQQDIQSIEKTLPSATKDQIPALEKQYKDALTRASIYQTMTKTWGPRDEENYIQKAVQNGATPEQAAEDLGKIKGVLQKTKDAQSHLNSGPDSFNILRKKIAVDPFWTDNTEAAAKVIQSLAPEELQKGIAVGYNRRLAREDYQGAYDYLRGHAYQIQQQKTKKETNAGATETERFPISGA